MNHRISRNVARSSSVDIEVNGEVIRAYEGESIATALLAAGIAGLSRDRSGQARGVFCNMGVCYDCVVLLTRSPDFGDVPVRVRSCLTPVTAGLCIRIPDSTATGLD